MPFRIESWRVTLPGRVYITEARKVESKVTPGLQPRGWLLGRSKGPFYSKYLESTVLPTRPGENSLNPAVLAWPPLGNIYTAFGDV